MNLCIVAPLIRKGDGQGRANYEVVCEALRRGHNLALIASQLDPSIEAHPNVAHFAPRARGPQLRYDIEFRRGSARWLERNRDRFDLVMTNGSATAAGADVTAVHFTFDGWWRTPHHTWKTDKTIGGMYQLLHTSLQRRWERSAFLKSKWHVAVSTSVKNELIALGVDKKTIVCIHNGVDISEFKPGPAKREAYGLPVNVPVGLFVGDIRLNRKNLGTVLKALARVPGVHLAVAGNTHRSPFPALSASLGLADRIHFLGAQEDVAKLMRSCDFFVLPSFYEPFSLAVLEAMACGLPAVVSEQVGASEILTKECGFVQPRPDDGEALARTMQLIATNPDLRRRMGVEARRIAERNSWSAKAAQYVDFLESRIKTPSRPPLREFAHAAAARA
jgi:glycosyltransferase involved in cell wall biosynthesis